MAFGFIRLKGWSRRQGSGTELFAGNQQQGQDGNSRPCAGEVEEPVADIQKNSSGGGEKQVIQLNDRNIPGAETEQPRKQTRGKLRCAEHEPEKHHSTDAEKAEELEVSVRVIPLQAVQNVQRRKIPADLLAHKPEAVVRKPDTVVQLPAKEPEPHKAQVVVKTYPRRQQEVKNQVINFVRFHHGK